tara:strand:- start:17 stop:583 length:567 start_codon:yes stop_codon:yes gene_type:complete
MSTIKTWQEREQLDIEPIRLPEECYMQAEITELREALKAAQAQIDSFCMDYRIKCDAETKALQAKLSAIEAQEPAGEVSAGTFVHWTDDNVPRCGTKLYAAPVAPAQPETSTERYLKSELAHVLQTTQPVNELVEAAERVSWKYGHDENGIPSDWTEWKDLRAALANAKAAQPLTKDYPELHDTRFSL